MKTRLTFLFLIIFVSTFGQTNQELEYLKTRNNYINYFKSIVSNTHSDDDWSKLDRQMDTSFLVLEKMLREIMNDSNIDSISKNGIINLRTLLEGDLGFGNLDGLILDKDSLQFFVTSKFLFKDYFKKENWSSTDNLTPQQFDNILTSALGGGDARTETLFAEKVSSANNSIVYYITGGFGQEDAPLMGKYIFLFAQKEDYVYIIWKYHPFAELQLCKSIYDKTYSGAQKYFERYDASNLNDTASLHQAFAIQADASEKYCECYQKNFLSDSQFEGFEKLMRKIEEYIEK
jgi:hypothetical protein